MRPSRRAGFGAATVSVLALALTLGGCGSLPEAKNLPDVNEAKRAQIEEFAKREPEAVQRILVPADTFRPMRMNSRISEGIAKMPVSFEFGPDATLDDLMTVIGALKLPVVVMGDEASRAMLSEDLPFRTYEGELEDLFDILRRTHGLVATQKGDFVYLGRIARYSVALPQNEEIMSTIASRIEELGGEDVIQSVNGGQLIYRAPPEVEEELIEPFLQRVSDNLAMVSLQVAVVSLAINDTTAQGFDWNAFKFAADSRSGGSSGGSVGGGASGGSGGSGVPALDAVGTFLDATSSAVSIGETLDGTLFGRAAVFSFAGAIDFLSNFGETNVRQNVELRTISGREVTLRSGQEVPYVSGVSSTTQDGATTGSAQTETVQTGLTLNLNPFYDAGSGLVTLDLGLEQSQVLDFVELNAGNEVGTITQPLTQDQSLDDLIRMPAGQTIVIGGLQTNNVSTRGAEPSFLLKHLDSDDLFGSRSRDVSRNAFFVVVRPTVTLFQREGS